MAGAHEKLPHFTMLHFMISNTHASEEGWAWVDSLGYDVCQASVLNDKKPRDTYTGISQRRFYPEKPLPTLLHMCQFFRAGELGFHKKRIKPDLFNCDSQMLVEPSSDLGRVNYKNRDGEARTKFCSILLYFVFLSKFSSILFYFMLILDALFYCNCAAVLSPPLSQPLVSLFSQYFLSLFFFLLFIKSTAPLTHLISTKLNFFIDYTVDRKARKAQRFFYQRGTSFNQLHVRVLQEQNVSPRNIHRNEQINQCRTLAKR